MLVGGCAPKQEQPPQPTKPNAPSNLEAQVISPTEVKLTWKDNSNNEDGFKIERKVENGNWQIIKILPANTTTYNDIGLTPQTTYYYRVKAYNSAGDSDYSNEVQVTTPTLVLPPNAPSNLQAIAISATEVKLTWQDNSDNELGFKIERKKEGEDWTEIATVGENVTTYNDTGLTPVTTYYYRVKAYNSAGDSDYSNEVQVTTPTLVLPPNAPSNLQATALSPVRIKLTWQDNSDNELGFKIERKTLDGTWTEIAEVGNNVTNYEDVGLTPQNTYYYRVKAYNSAGDSDYSNEAQVTTPSLTWNVYDWTTNVEPPTDWVAQNYMNNYCTIQDGILIFDTTYSVGITSDYRYNFSSSVDTGFTMTIVFKAKGEAGTTYRSWTFDFQNKYRGGLEITPSGIRLLNGTSTLTSTTTITGSDWHTYYLTFEVVSDGINANLYIDGESTPTLSGKITSTTNNTYMRLGDTSSTASYKGYIDWIFWTFDCAEPPSIVPLPPGYTLTP